MKYLTIYLTLILNFTSLSYGATHAGHKAPIEHNKIHKVPISIKNAASAKEAKLMGLEEAKRKSLTSLISKIYPKKQISLENVSNEDIENFINGFEIYQEKISANSYHALIDVSFNLNLIHKKFDNFPDVVDASSRDSHSEKSTISKQGEEQKLITCYSKITELSNWTEIKYILQNKIKSIEDVKPLFIDKNMIIFEIIFVNDPSITADDISENMASNGIFLEIDAENKIELKYSK